MIVRAKCDKIFPVKNGWVTCPICRNKRMMQILPDSQARRIVAFCRDCKTEHIVDIDRGQCFESQSQ